MNTTLGPDKLPNRRGLLFGALAVLFWSFSSALVYLGARELGTFQFTCLATLIGGTVQLVSGRIYHGEFRSAVFLPGRLWLIVVFGFVLYGLVYPWSLITARTPERVCAVNLINYLWPVLTVVFCLWWVPGTRFSRRTFLALVLALAGLGLANAGPLRTFLAQDSHHLSSIGDLLPYGLGLLSAVSWAMYSSMLVRWREWSRNYLTSGVGFLVISLCSGVAAALTPDLSRPVTPFAVLMTVLYGLGPLAGGYLFWELALPRARVQTLSLLGSVTPVLSVLLLCVFMRYWPGMELLAAAVLVSGGVVLSMRS